ncbi:heme acquisition protein HasA [Yersinia rohdei]|uniref:heme acquisition protein HasA n=1 Tax=Yersinia rohdei TaxID=29485 RepID=UPI0025AA6701|nr:heme acquisition protein HasA [Yersinia rohdei]MDN0094101.1 heme acquisition protein HasA [Yersinia rohdei]
MSVTIKYNSEVANASVSSYLNEWAEGFGDINQAATKIRGDFAGGGWFNGTQYSVKSSYDTDVAMITEGTLTYSFMPQHTFFGQMDSIQFGKDLIPNPSGTDDKILNTLQLSFNDVDISGTFDPTKEVEVNRDGDLHKSVHGLMRANPEPFLELLKAKGIDVDIPLKDMAIASQYDIMADAPIIDTVGAYDGAEILMAA